MLYSLDEVGPLVADPAVSRDFERTSGLPWHRTVAELEALYGVKSWRGFVDVVPLRGVRALGFGDTVEFRHRVFAPRRFAPAYDFQADLNPFGEFRANHNWALDHLAALFGRPPRLADVSNCLQGRWDFGLIEVSVSTFLPARHPDLEPIANLTVESRLCAYRELVQLDLSDGIDLQGIGMGRGDFLTNRLLAASPVVSSLRLWRDRAGKRVGVANRWGTIVRPWLTGSRLQLCERTPARGGGSGSLDWDGVELLKSAAWDGLRESARQTADFFGTPLEIHTEPDE